jgi:adenine C2-methylase RlmN of 23S rRNA A2503 and tRNA A37
MDTIPGININPNINPNKKQIIIEILNKHGININDKNQLFTRVQIILNLYNTIITDIDNNTTISKDMIEKIIQKANIQIVKEHLKNCCKDKDNFKIVLNDIKDKYFNQMQAIFSLLL